MRNQSTALRQLNASFKTKLNSLVLSHLHYFILTINQLSKTPLSTFMTSAALGIALALPAGLYEVMLTIQKAGGNLDNIHKISLFLKSDVSDQQAKELQQHIKKIPGVVDVKYKNKQQSLSEFKQHSGFGDALKSLKSNPLPHVIIVEPSILYLEPVNLHKLLNELKIQPEVEIAQLDVQWLKKLFSLIEVGKTGIIIISSLLGLAVLLIIGNTIRLAIENKRQEILITKLIGGTNSFIRRPFLYLGFWYGLLGGILAVFLVDISLLIISQPLSTLSELYHSDLLNLGITALSHNIQLLIISIILGLLGALFAVNRQLKLIEPT